MEVDLKDLDTALLTHNFFSWSYLAVLHLCLFCFPAQGHCGPLPHRAPGDHTPWLAISAPKTGRIWRGYRHIWFHNAYLFLVRDSRDLLTPTYRCLPVYTDASCNHFVYTAGTFGFVKGQNATELSMLNNNAPNHLTMCKQ